MSKETSFCHFAFTMAGLALISCASPASPTPSSVPVTGVTLNTKTLELTVGGSSFLSGSPQLIATILPNTATNTAVSWTSGNPTVARVSGQGLVSPVAAGTAMVTVTTADGSKTANCFVNVTNLLMTVASAFMFPWGITVDPSGNLYIADETSSNIFKVTSSGAISAVAGSGKSGFSGDGGLATSAQLYLPTSVAIDSAGNLYLADARNNRIRKVNTSGLISTIAGNGTAGYSGDGGAATSAELNDPFGVAVDSIGNLYVVDDGNNRIRKVSASGLITTVAGNGTAGFSGDGGPATAAELTFGANEVVASVAVDSQGNLYIADAGNYRVRKVNTAGVISTVAGSGWGSVISGDGGAATAATIAPGAVAVDSAGNLYITNNVFRISKISTDGTIITLADSLSGFDGLAADSKGDLYATTTAGQVVSVSTSSSAVSGGTASSSVVSGGSTTSGAFVYVGNSTPKTDIVVNGLYQYALSAGATMATVTANQKGPTLIPNANQLDSYMEAAATVAWAVCCYQAQGKTSSESALLPTMYEDLRLAYNLQSFSYVNSNSGNQISTPNASYGVTYGQVLGALTEAGY